MNVVEVRDLTLIAGIAEWSLMNVLSCKRSCNDFEKTDL